MRSPLIIVIALMIAMAGCVAAVPAGDIRIITEDNPPYNFYDERGNITGQSTEVVKEIAKELGGEARIEMLPWAEGYELVQKEPGTMLYSTSRIPARDAAFKWVGPIGFDDEWFYTKRGSDIQIGSLDDAKKVGSIATYKDDANEVFLTEKGFVNLQMNRDDRECILKLVEGKADLWMGTASRLSFITYDAGINPAELQPVLYVTRFDFYMAFNRNTPDSVIKSWQASLDKMKESPDGKTMSRYEKIITSYALPQYSASSVTREQVIQLVESTAKDIVADAPGTISKMNSRSAPYLDSAHPELYAYIYDRGCNEIANASNPSIVGHCLKGIPDMAGKLFRDNIVDGAINNGSGWEDYVFTMPGQVGLFHKSAYYRLAKGSDGRDYIVCSGLYKSSPEK